MVSLTASTVLYSSNDEGRVDLWAASADGGAPVRLTTSGNSRDWARWSPDGREIAFVSTDGGARHIRVMSAGGGDDRPLVAGPGGPDQVEWSPDGERLVLRLEPQRHSGHLGDLAPMADRRSR